MDFLSSHIKELMVTGMFGAVGYALKVGATWLWDKKFQPFMDKIEGGYQIALRSETTLKELKMNGGASIKDVVNKINHTTQEIKTDVDYIKKRNANRIYMDSQPIFESDENGNCFRVNKRWMELTGYSQEEAAGYGWMGCIANEVAKQRVYDKWDAMIKDYDRFDEVFQIRNNINKEPITVRCIAIVERNAKRSIEYILATMEKI